MAYWIYDGFTANIARECGLTEDEMRLAPRMAASLAFLFDGAMDDAMCNMDNRDRAVYESTEWAMAQGANGGLTRDRVEELYTMAYNAGWAAGHTVMYVWDTFSLHEEGRRSPLRNFSPLVYNDRGEPLVAAIDAHSL